MLAARPSQREVLPLACASSGQMGLTYIVTEGPDGMYLIDQHAAHERVLFDRLQAAPVAGLRWSNPCLEPQSR